MPARWRLPVVALGAAYALGLAWVYSLQLPSPDQAIFQYIGWRASEGSTLYADVAEQNWPGIMYLHEASLRLFGAGARSWRLVDFLLLLVGAFSLRHLVARSAGELAGLLVLGLYPWIYVAQDAWFAGQRDVVATHVLLGAGVVFLGLDGSSRPGRAALLGALAAYATLIRPTYLLAAPLFLLVDQLTAKARQRTLRRRGLDALFAAAGLATVFGAAALGALALGSLDDWYLQTIVFNTTAYGGLQQDRWTTLTALADAARDWLPVAPVGLFGLGLWAQRSRFDAPWLVVVGLALMSVTSALVQNKGFGYHLGAVPQALAAGMAVAVGAALRYGYGQRRPLARAGALAVVLLTAAGCVKVMAWKRALVREGLAASAPTESERAQLLAAGAFLAAHSKEDDTVLVWGRQVMLNVLAERQSPLRFICVGVLDAAGDSFPRTSAWLAELDDALTDAPPALVVARALDDPAWAEGGVLAGRASTRVREALEASYVEAASFGELRVFQRDVP